MNRKLVLKLLYRHKGLPKSRLSRFTGLSIPAVTKIVNDLEASGHVEVLSGTHQGRGNHQGMVKITQQIPNTICLNVSPLFVSAIALDNHMSPLCDLHQRDIQTDSPEDLVEQIIQLIVEISASAGVENYRLALAVHGQVDIKSGASLRMPHASWQHDFELKYILQTRLKVEILLDNDCVMLALAEKWLHDNNDRDFCVLNIGEGIGSSFLINGDIYRGPHFGSGQIGHTFVGANGLICGCGREGCLETEASIPAMCLRYSGMKGVKVTFSQLVQLYEQGEPDAVEVVLRAAKFIGLTLYNFLVTLDINKIFLYGETCCLGERWLSTIVRETLSNPFESGLHWEQEVTSISFGALTEAQKLEGIGYLWVENELNKMSTR